MARKTPRERWLMALYLLCIALIYAGSIPLIIYGCPRERPPHGRLRDDWDQLKWVERTFTPDSWSREYRENTELLVGLAMAGTGLVGGLVIRLLMPVRFRDDD